MRFFELAHWRRRLCVLAFSACLLPALASAASLSLEERVVLGRTEEVGVTLRVEEPPGQEDRPLRLSVNVGGFGPVTRVSPGVYRTVYRPPRTRFPQLALVALWRETGPEAPITFVRLPLYGSTRMPVEAAPGSKVLVEVGTDSFGPVTTDKKGRAEVPLLVPPLVPEAVVTVTDDEGQVTRKRSVVQVPGYNRLTLALVPHAIVANGEDWARVEVFYDTGGKVDPRTLRLTPSVGRAEFVKSEPNGRYIYRYVPPVGTREREVSFRVSVEGDKLAQGNALLELGLLPAATVAVVPPEAPLVADGTSKAPVRVRVLDAKGLGLPEQKLEVMVAGKLLSGVRYEGQGEYVVDVPAPSTYPREGRLEVSAAVERPDGETVSGTGFLALAAPRVPHQAEGQVQPAVLLADGTSRASVTFEVRDAAGAGLEGASLSAKASDGTLGPLVELGQGRYRAEYTAPGGVPPGGEAVVELADAGGFRRTVSVGLRPVQRLLLGVRGGWGHGLGQRSGARGGLDAWLPLKLGPVPVGLGLSALYARAEQGVAVPQPSVGALVQWVPVTLRAGVGLVDTPLFSLHLGGGGALAWGQMRVTPSGRETFESRLGPMGFLSGALSAGPGQLFLELSYAHLPLFSREFFLQAGGAAVDLGYRVAVF